LLADMRCAGYIARNEIEIEFLACELESRRVALARQRVLLTRQAFVLAAAIALAIMAIR
jgi:hypothetical protein